MITRKQYPAVKDEWADPQPELDGDSKEKALIRPLLKNTNLERRGLKLTFSYFCEILSSSNNWQTPE